MPAATTREVSVFAFFSSRLGCLGSLLVSIIGTIIGTSILPAVLNLFFWG